MHCTVEVPAGAALVLPAPEEQLRLMHVHAHPDDESSKGAASTARYVADGVDVLVVSCTGGERGDILNPAVDSAETRADLPAVRRLEMQNAAQILGIRHIWLGFVDSGYPQPDDNGVLPDLPAGCFAEIALDEPVAALVRLIREHRPHVLTTYDENGGYPHPDHIRCHEVSVAAVSAAADPGYQPESGSAWQVAKVYYHAGFHYKRVKTIHDAALAAGIESPFAAWLADWDHSGDREITTFIPCEPGHFRIRDEALRAHATQIDPQRWFVVPPEQQHAVWPTEDFELARTWVPVSLPEDDLFAGLRESSSTPGQLDDPTPLKADA